MTEPKQKVKYNYEFLQKYSDENNIKLLKDYSNEKVNRDTKIEAKCVTENCDEIVNKNFRYYIEHGVYCKLCSITVIKNKIKKTNLEKYGVENVFKNEKVKEKIKQTNLEKYGVENPNQNKDIKEKIKITCLERYGVESPLKNDSIKEKIKLSCLERYGVNYPQLNSDIRDKSKITNLKRYGSIHVLQNTNIKEKVKQTCLYRYGVEHHLKLDYFKNKSKQTCLEKYGVENPAQNSEIMDKMSKNAYKLKDYILPSGNTIKVQGYEHYAYDELLNIENIKEEDIVNGVLNVPEVWYYKDDIKKRHYVDIYIPSQNRCIEVKSTWTAKKKQDNIFLKQQASKELGYNYEIWIYNGKGEKVECYK